MIIPKRYEFKTNSIIFYIGDSRKKCESPRITHDSLSSPRHNSLPFPSLQLAMNFRSSGTSHRVSTHPNHRSVARRWFKYSRLLYSVILRKIGLVGIRQEARRSPYDTQLQSRDSQNIFSKENQISLL